MIVKLVTLETTDGSGRILQLTLHKEYEVLGIECNHYRLVPEKYDNQLKLGPYLYDHECFEVIDRVEPDFWVTTIEDGNRYSYPRDWASPGFFEDYHDGVHEIRTRFWSRLAELYPNTWQSLNDTGQLKYLRIS